MKSDSRLVRSPSLKVGQYVKSNEHWYRITKPIQRENGKMLTFGKRMDGRREWSADGLTDEPLLRLDISAYYEVRDDA